MDKPAPRRSWCFGEYFHTTDPVECSCAEDLEPGSKHDVTATPRPLSDMELSAIQGWVNGEFDTDNIETAKHWAGRLLSENRRLRSDIKILRDDLREKV